MPDIGDQGTFFRNNVAGTRQQADFEPIGIRVGSLIGFPKGTLEFGRNSNVFNSDTRRRGDEYLRVEPALRLTTDWGRHALGIGASAGLTRYATLTRQNSDAYRLDADGRLDIDAGTAVTFSLSHGRAVAPPGEGGEQTLDGSPAAYNETSVRIGARRDAGDIRIVAASGATWKSYAGVERPGGIVVPQNFRDISTLGASLRTDVAIGGGGSVFVDADALSVRSPNLPACCRRNASGASIIAGARAELGAQTIAEVAVGYLFRNYKAPLFTDYGGVTYRAAVDWYPTPLFSVRINAGRSIANSAIPSVAGILTTTLSLRAHYEVLRNLSLVATAGRTAENYRELGLRTTTRTFDLELRHALGRRLTYGVFGRLRDRNASDRVTVRGYDGSDVGVWFRLAL